MTQPYVLVDSLLSPSLFQTRLALITPPYLLPGLLRSTPFYMYPLSSLALSSTIPWSPPGPKTLPHYLRPLSLTLPPLPALRMPSTLTFMPCQGSCLNDGTRLTSGASIGGMCTVRPPSPLSHLSKVSHAEMPSRPCGKPSPK